MDQSLILFSPFIPFMNLEVIVNESDAWNTMNKKLREIS